MAESPIHYNNQLEPSALIDDFLAYPPEGFAAQKLADGTPVFATPYNLFTTLKPSINQRLKRLPLYSRWSKWFAPYSYFVGTTVSEYALIPQGTHPEPWVRDCKAQLNLHCAFLILKDLPQDSPFLTTEENACARACLNAAKNDGFMLVEGQALAYVPIDFSSEEEYLQRLSKATRKSLKRKLHALDHLEISYVPTGDSMFADTAVCDQFYRLYLSVYAQSELHFDKLTPDFFVAMLRNAQSGGVVVIYRYHNEMIGYNICFVQGEKFIDKYIGFDYSASREHQLYFVSWFVNLRYAREHGLKWYIAGWTDPEVKKSLGASFTFTRHAVYIRNPLMRALLKPLVTLFERDAHIKAA